MMDQSDTMTAPLYRYTFTVFTATYNRAATLPRVYDSLCAQTWRDFEWLIVDDGSSDDTAALVRLWEQEDKLALRYIVQDHHGKQVAFNRAVQEAEGEFFLPLDSDDACLPQALERFHHHWQSIPASQRAQFSAVTVTCLDQHGQLVGDPFPISPMDSDSVEMDYKFKVTGEKWGFHRTAILRHFPFPTAQAVNIPEGIVWHRIARRYKTRYVNEPLRIYWHDEQDRTDHLSAHTPYEHSAAGQVLWGEFILNQDIDWLASAPRHFITHAVYYTRFSCHAGRPLRGQVRALHNGSARVLWLVTLPLGLLAYYADRSGKTSALKQLFVNRRIRLPTV